MANICNNDFFLSKKDSQEDFNKSLANINDFISEYGIGEVSYSDNDIAEGYFDSPWTFPISDFRKLLVGDVYFRCLSQEYGCDYVAMNIFDNGWLNEQTFDL